MDPELQAPCRPVASSRQRLRDRGGLPMRMMSSFRNDERGATIALVAICMMAFMGMVVLVVDVGGLLTLRRRMVTAADSAALAAAQSCAKMNAAEAPGQADEL